MRTLSFASTLVFACTGSLAAQHPALAQPKPSISIELNDKRQVEKGCRLAFVFTNGLPVTITDLSLEFVLFDKQRKLMRLVAIAAGRLPSGKTRLKQFDMEGASCESIGRILLNDVKRCSGEGLTGLSCLERTQVTSRVEIPFGS
jgi:hypothetical protein